MTAPLEREYATFRRGDLRELILLPFLRNGLRALTNPKTGQLFTEDEVRRATTAGSRFYIEADAIDLVGQGIEKKDEFLAQQMRIDRAGSAALSGYHGPQWGETYLPATGGSGSVQVAGSLPGTAFTGSTTIPDPFATYALDPASKRYQVLVSESADVDGNATLLMVGIDGGSETNIAIGTILTWGNPPAGAAPFGTVIDDDFSGGGPAETDAEFSDRLAARVRRKPGAGNESQMRDIARSASNAVEDAFPYPCALNAGSTLVAVTQKRKNATGPEARLPSVGTLAAVTQRLVPPGSADIPARAFVAVLSPVSEPTSLTLQVAQRTASASGWTDRQPFPPVRTAGAAVALSTVTNQQDFRVTTDAAGQLPGGVAGPLSGVSLMVWDVPSSRWEVLSVLSVTDLGAGIYRALLAAPPAHTLTVGDYVSPGMSPGQADVLAESVEAYFDSLGPGELIDVSTDPLAVRAFRRPVPTEEWPQRAGQQLTQFVFDGVGAAITDASVTILGATVPSVPGDPIDGPSLLTLGKCAVYVLA
jgi:hypothetical protein